MNYHEQAMNWVDLNKFRTVHETLHMKFMN